MKIPHFPESRERRFKNVKVSPNIETLENIRATVAKVIDAHGIKLVAITGPWDGAILTALDDLAVTVVAVDANPSEVLKKMATECGASIVDTIPEETDLLIIDSALNGRALKDATAALKLGIAHVIIHNTNPQLSNMPPEMKTALEGALLLNKSGYSFEASPCISQDGGRRGLEYGFNAAIEKPEVAAPIVTPDAASDTKADEPVVGDTGAPGVLGETGIPAADPNVDAPVTDSTAEVSEDAVTDLSVEGAGDDSKIEAEAETSKDVAEDTVKNDDPNVDPPAPAAPSVAPVKEAKKNAPKTSKKKKN